MSSNSIGGLSSAFDRETFGAQVVSATLDTMNGQGFGNNYAITDRESFGAAVVSKTLDYMNSGNSYGSDMNQTYDFSKSVLGGYMAGKGAIADYNI